MSVTLITGLWDIGREDLQPGWNRSFQHYLECFSKLLATDLNMTIYGDNQLEKFVFERRNKSNTHFIERPLEYFMLHSQYLLTERIRTNGFWDKGAGWLTNSPQAALPFYNPIVMSKLDMLTKCAFGDNHFKSSHLFWIDAGIANTVRPSLITNQTIEKLSAIITKMLFLCFPYETSNEIHGFTYSEMYRIVGAHVRHVARGGFFGGTPSAIIKTLNQYNPLLEQTLRDSLMGTEESIFSMIAHMHPELCNSFKLESNGFIAPFFEQLQHNNVTFADLG